MGLECVQNPREAHKNFNLFGQIWSLSWSKYTFLLFKTRCEQIFPLDFKNINNLWSLKHALLLITSIFTSVAQVKQTSLASKQAEKWQTDFTGWSVLGLNFNSLKCKVVSKQTVVWNWNQTGALCGGVWKRQLLPQSMVKKNKRLFTSNGQCSLKPEFINKMFLLLWLCFVLLLEDCC